MMSERIYLASPHMGGSERRYVDLAFDTNWIAPLGANVTGFEQDLQQYLGAGYVTALSAGTAALHLAVRLAGVQRGDRVFCQSLTFSASANPIVYEGGEPVFLDSEPDTWNLDPETIEAAIARFGAPKALIAVHLYGMPGKLDAIRSLCDAHGILLIEDAAEALGSVYHGQKCGTFGHYGVLSFNGNKIITTSGGGALVCRDEADAQHALKMATQAREPVAWYEHTELGYNYRMSNICAGIGRGQMEVLEQRVAQKRAIHDRYCDALAGLPLQLPAEPGGRAQQPLAHGGAARAGLRRHAGADHRGTGRAQHRGAPYLEAYASAAGVSGLRLCQDGGAVCRRGCFCARRLSAERHEDDARAAGAGLRRHSRPVLSGGNDGTNL